MVTVTRIKQGMEVIDWNNGGDSVPSVVFDVAVDTTTLAADFATYDPSSDSSPSVEISRKYARAIFDAWAAAQQEG